ncbi:MAG: hypothetical protein NC311_20410, partial [Muribaculaceae bacterium]|nr:hypothetical protein [Muribaculaceae bacterium]
SITGITGEGIRTGNGNDRLLTLTNASVSGGTYGVFVDTGADVTAAGCTFSGGTAALRANGVVTAQNCQFGSDSGMGLDLRSKASTLTGCTVTADGYGISVSTGASVVLSDGSFAGAPALYVDQTGGARLSGGTFNGGIQSSGTALQNLLASKYAYFIGGAKQTLAGGQKELSGNITVEPEPDIPDSPGKTVLVTVDGDTTEYEKLTDAWNFAQGKNAHIQVRESESVGQLNQNSGAIVIDMDEGVELSSSGIIFNVINGSLTISSGVLRSSSKGPVATDFTGSSPTVNITGGELYGAGYAVECRGKDAAVNISGGKLSASSSLSYAVYVYSQNPQVRITGGTFSGAFGVFINSGTDGASVQILDGAFTVTRYAVNQREAKSRLEIYGGRFQGGESSTSGALCSVGNTTVYGGTFINGIEVEGGSLADLLPPEKVFLQEDGQPFAGASGTSTETSPLTVGNCPHIGSVKADNDKHVITCTVCGKVTTEGSHTWTDNVCTDCGVERVAQVGSDYYISFEEAWAALDGRTGTLRLLKSVTTSTTLMVGSGMDVTIEMDDGVTLTNNDADCFQVSGGKLTLASGKVVEGKSGKSVVYASSGTLCVTGGTCQSAGNGLWIDSGVDVRLSGGTLKVSGAALRYQNKSVRQMLDTTQDGKEFDFSDGDRWIVNGLDGEKLEGVGSVTVLEVPPCRHDRLEYKDLRNDFHGGICPDCGREIRESHSYDDGICTVCDAKAVVEVKIDSETTTYYSTIEAAWAAARTAAAATVTLLDNVTITSTLGTSSGNTITLELNGKSIAQTGRNYAFNLSGGSLTVQGDGSIIAEQYTVINMQGASLTLKGGTIEAKESYHSGIWMDGGTVDVYDGATVISQSDANVYSALFASGGTANIHGGTFIGGVGVNIVNGGRLILSGGTFSAVTEGGASVDIMSRATLRDLLDKSRNSEGIYYAYYKDGAAVSEGLDGRTLYGTVTVGVCEHPERLQDNGNGTHGSDCPYCGAEFAAATHTP